jgi:hypothetical protein
LPPTEHAVRRAQPAFGRIVLSEHVGSLDG